MLIKNLKLKFRKSSEIKKENKDKRVANHSEFVLPSKKHILNLFMLVSTIVVIKNYQKNILSV